MLKKGFLAKNSVYVSIAHTDILIKKYLNNLNNIFLNLKNYKEILKNKNIKSIKDFKRFN